MMPPLDEERVLDQVRIVLRDPNLHFPRHPRLPRDICIFVMPDGLGVQIRGTGEPVLLVGQHADLCTSFLQTRMTGTLSFEELLDACPSNIPRSVLAKAIHTLHSKGLLREGPEVHVSEAFSSDRRRFVSELYWERYLNVTGYNGTSEEVLSRIGNASLVLIAEGLFGAIVFRVLGEAGFTSIRGISIGASDAFANNGVSIGFPKLSKNQLVELRSLIHGLKSPTDLVVIATRNSSAEFLKVLNFSLLETGVAFMMCNESAEGFDIGPLVLPYRTACYECMLRRATSMNPAAIEEELYQKHLQASSHSQTFLQGENLAGAYAAAGLLVNDVVKTVSKVGTSSLVEAVMRFDPMNGVPTVNRFLRVPHCPSCKKVDTLSSRAVSNDDRKTSSHAE